MRESDLWDMDSMNTDIFFAKQMRIVTTACRRFCWAYVTSHSWRTTEEGFTRHSDSVVLPPTDYIKYYKKAPAVTVASKRLIQRKTPESAPVSRADSISLSHIFPL